MILARQQIKQTVHDYFKDKPVKKAYLFGSYATGQAQEDNDVDILFQLEQGTRMTYFGTAPISSGLRNQITEKS